MKRLINILMLLTLTLLVLAGSGCSTKKEVSLPPLPGQNLTPLIGEVITEPQTVKLSDGKHYLMYELNVTNTTPSDYSIEKLTLEDPLNKNKVVGEYSVDDIKGHFQVPKKDSPTNILNAHETGIITFCLILEKNEVPKAIDHVLSVKTGTPVSILPAETTERIARTRVDTDKPVVIGPPLNGDNWLAANVADNYGHRNALFPLNGSWFVPERWAVDYVKLDSENKVVSEDVNIFQNYPGYDQDLLAVSDGTVLKVVDEFDDLGIGKVLENMSLANLGGNYVLIDIGGGYSAFYAHLIKGTAKVKKGDKVKRRQVIGKLGNSGNSSGPHLHFHIVKGRDPISAQGVPYVINKFKVIGQEKEAGLPEEFFAGAPLEMNTKFKGARTNEMPADNTVVSFPKPKAESTPKSESESGSESE